VDLLRLRGAFSFAFHRSIYGIAVDTNISNRSQPQWCVWPDDGSQGLG